jgi:hypothetical protein
MENHHHIILRARPDLLRKKTNEELARRWLRALPRRVDFNGVPLEPNQNEVGRMALDPEKMRKIRSRLSDISWFMEFLNEYIARKANAEDKVTGRFFEGRFKCKALLDEASVLACMAYVDLNPIRAGSADAPENSEFTGACERIGARQGKAKIKALAEARRSGSKEVAARGRLNQAQVEVIRSAKRARLRDRWLCRVDSRAGAPQPPARRGLFPVSVDEYLELLDWTGQQVRADKRGAIPEHLAPILKRLTLDVNAWLRMVEGMGNLFWRVVGRIDAMVRAARLAGKRWFRGLAASRMAFGSG